ncbi:MAG: TetR/AcrR family transcriptional regulator [Novosphingobium sp.]
MSSAPVLTRRRTREAPEVRRARILDEAIRLIGERGYYGFTVQELAQRCGLTNPGLLHYYPSKLDLLLAALAEMEVRSIAVMEPIVAAAERELSGAHGREGVLAVLRSIIVGGTTSREMVRFLAELQAESLSPSHPAFTWWQRREAGMRDLFTRLLHPFLTDPEHVARQVIALIDGLCLQWLRADGTMDIEAEWDRMLARMLPELHDNQGQMTA